MEDTELVRRLRVGDETAYRLIVDQYQSSILNCCYRFVREKEPAEDLTQEVFLEVYRSIHSFKAKSKFSTWLYRIAITKSLDHIKYAKRKKRFGFLRSLSSADESEITMLPSTHPDPQQILENEDRKKILSWAVESLPENQKVAFTLCTSDELSYKEIADILDTTVASVESLLFRARSNLKKKLYTYYQEHL
jgi:RNA polymerase sigma-70 factor (ECF subfamily)